MALEFEENELMELMKNFHILTGLLIVLCDTDYNPLIRFPKNPTHFCACMKANPNTEKLCIQSDKQSMNLCKQTGRIVIYHCHAGLIEACAPLKSDGQIIGYMMFGQISDFPSHKLLNSHLKSYINTYLKDMPNSKDWSADIPFKTTEQIQAAAKILEACTVYAISENTVRYRRQNFITNMNAYLNEHLDEDLSVDRLVREFGISRSKLYQTCDMYLGHGIATHILSLRMERAKKLLRETKLSVTDVATNCGFNDYNYFCRVFKKEVGTPAGKYRQIE